MIIYNDVDNTVNDRDHEIIIIISDILKIDNIAIMKVIVKTTQSFSQKYQRCNLVVSLLVIFSFYDSTLLFRS